MRRAALVLCCAALVIGAMAPPARATPDPPPRYLPPVDAPVVDPFRPPTTSYGAGNRGLEYGTAPDTPVRVAADGVVAFAGPVAGSLHVTVRHPDGVRTTYSFLARVDVVVGQRLRQGDLVGSTRDRLHLGARQGDAYFDPASLFGGAPPRVHLVPFDDPPGEGEVGERLAIGQLVGGVGGLVASGAEWLRSGSLLVGTFAHYADRFGFPGAMPASARTLLSAWQRARLQSERPCSSAGIDPPPRTDRRRALLVAGLGSSSRGATVEDVDTTRLGYAPSDVLRFSYAGGRTPDDSDGLPTIGSSEYIPADTQADLRQTGFLLADLVEDVVAADPRVPVDLYAHSQGGVVARLALIELEARHGADWLRHVGLMATLGSPHRGAELATSLYAISTTRSGGDLLDAYAQATDMALDDDGASVAQLSQVSDVVDELEAHPIPDTVPSVSIAARGDLIVPVPSTRAPGAVEVVVSLTGPDAHTDLPGSAAANRELRLALAGLPPGCRSFDDALRDQLTGEAISYGEDLVGALGWAVTSGTDLRQ
ncbi:MAG: peptidoglycan DD-metalloendopeptidase family protein [Chloroflexota bacterium]|nr:peptidoglycan DD-metalloendopeptidase family protein [Chloroflexota bacterium]